MACLASLLAGISHFLNFRYDSDHSEMMDQGTLPLEHKRPSLFPSRVIGQRTRNVAFLSPLCNPDSLRA